MSLEIENMSLEWKERDNEENYCHGHLLKLAMTLRWEQSKETDIEKWEAFISEKLILCTYLFIKISLFIEKRAMLAYHFEDVNF